MWDPCDGSGFLRDVYKFRVISSWYLDDHRVRNLKQDKNQRLQFHFSSSKWLRSDLTEALFRPGIKIWGE